MFLKTSDTSSQDSRITSLVHEIFHNQFFVCTDQLILTENRQLEISSQLKFVQQKARYWWFRMWVKVIFIAILNTIQGFFQLYKMNKLLMQLHNLIGVIQVVKGGQDNQLLLSRWPIAWIICLFRLVDQDLLVNDSFIKL